MRYSIEQVSTVTLSACYLLCLSQRLLFFHTNEELVAALHALITSMLDCSSKFQLRVPLKTTSQFQLKQNTAILS